MNLSPEAIAFLADRGMSMADLAEFVRLSEHRKDPTAAERQRRCRDNKRGGKRHAVTVTRDPLIEEDHNPSSPPSSSNDDDCPPLSDRFVSVWNERAKSVDLPEARPLNPDRKAKLAKRAKEFGEAAVLEAIPRLMASSFHCGANERGWKASAGWLLKTSENMAKALDLPLPDAPQPGRVDPVATAESAAALYRRMGRDADALEAEKRAERLRGGSTGPPRAIGEVAANLRTFAGGP